MDSSVDTAPHERSADTELLWNRFSDDLRRYIARRVQRPEDVEDILQTAFVRIQTRLSTLREDDRLLGWLYVVTRNAITDHYRQASNRREMTVGEIPAGIQPLEDEQDDEATAEAELAACLRPMIAKLPPEQAAAVEIVEIGGVSQVEASRQAGVSVSGMKSRVQRGRARLRELLLDCCSVSQDVRGRVQEFAPRDGGSCGGC